MSKEIYISSTPQETRLAIVEGDELNEIYYERENEYTLAGSIYNGRVTRVLPGMQSSFVDIGLERDAFLYITDFMEEQGDAAEFDSGAGRGERGRRRENGRGEERNGRRERGSRGSAAGAESADRETADEAGDEEEFVAGAGREEREPESAAEGEGSRRWRGRRGRRRGRGAQQEQAAEGSSQEQTGAARDESDESGWSAGEDAGRSEERAARERGGDRRGERSRGEGRRGERGGRPDDRRHNEIRERFAPRGSRGAGANDDEGVELNASAVEPFILPGESLSKYRRGQEREEGNQPVAESSASAAAKPVVKAKPSTEVAALEGWDGGFVLPGETLSRRRGAESDSRVNESTEGREQREPRSREERSNGRSGGGRDRRRERDERRGRAPREDRAVEPEGIESETATEPMYVDRATLETEAQLQALKVEEQIDRVDPLYEPQTAVVEELHAAPVEEVEEAFEEFHEVTTEYEPEEDASASFRVDAAAPREFRQATVLEQDAFLAAEREGEAEAAAAENADDAAAVEHEFTSVQASGEMISDVEDVIAPEETTSPAAPIEHERAVQGVHLHESEGTPLPNAGASQEFAPGEGELEEELIDDEDDGVFVLAGGAAFDEEMEEETLEGVADLGSVLRDMSIDQIVAPEPVELDDEEIDFDDEEMEEDELDSDESIGSADISEIEEEESAESSEFEEGAEAEPEEQGEAATPRRERGGRERRGDRRGGRERGGSRDRRGMAGSRSGGRMSRATAQRTDLPAISDLLKPGQEVLVQIAKEPIAKKGARITSHIALPGRFLVFMPTVNHVGVSRKIESDGERRRLREILLSEKGEATGGFIVRTAAAGASEDELRSDLRFLLNLWADIKQRSESSKSPALIYHDLNLVERILRDQVTDNFSAIWCDTEDAYERILRFLQRFQPSLIRRVKLYTKETPLFEQFGIQEEINKALRSKVWLKSGGSIVINQTEALVAIDINTGKYVGKTARLEDTIVKTNLDAIPEIVRQIRLRDLGGIIVIDFIDMDERKNRHKVLAALEEELKKDRAPSKVLQFNDFGLVAITRKRVKQSLERTLSTTCSVCTGTGMVKSPVTVCNEIYIELRKMHRHLEKGDIMLRVNPEVVKQLKAGGGKWLQEMEEMSGKTILVKSDPSLHPEQFDLH